MATPGSSAVNVAVSSGLLEDECHQSLSQFVQVNLWLHNPDDTQLSWMAMPANELRLGGCRSGRESVELACSTLESGIRSSGLLWERWTLFRDPLSVSQQRDVAVVVGRPEVVMQVPLVSRRQFAVDPIQVKPPLAEFVMNGEVAMVGEAGHLSV